MIMACRPRVQFFQRALMFFKFLTRLSIPTGRHQFLIILKLLNCTVD